MLLETVEPRRRDVVEREVPRTPEREEAPLKFALPALAARHNHLARHQPFRVQQAGLAAGEVPLDENEGRHVAEIVAELLVGADQCLQKPSLTGIETAQHQRQEGRLAARVLEAEHGVRGLTRARIG